MSRRLTNDPPILNVKKSRAFDVFHGMFRLTRQFMTTRVIEQMNAAYDEFSKANPNHSYEEAEKFADNLPQFQVFSWATRHFLRMRTYTSGLGVEPTVKAQRDDLLADLRGTVAVAGDQLRLNPNLKLPEYYTSVDYHQQAGGIWSDEIAGVIYETGRRVALLTESGAFNIYKWSYSQIPEGSYRKVLDWGTGAGAGLFEWQSQHPESECYGVDLSGPCLMVAHRRAVERGYRMFFSQQNLAALDFPDGSFDLVFHMFMFHEIPTSLLPGMLKEVHRILKPGGLFCGPEIRLTPGHNFLNVLQRNQAICTNEVYSNAWHVYDLAKAAREVGFSKVSVEPWKAALTANDGKSALPSNHFEYYTLTK